MQKAEAVKYLKEKQLSKEGKRVRWLERCYKLSLIEGVSMEDLLKQKGIKHYLVYGLNDFSKLLVYSSKREDHECLGVIDRNAKNINVQLPLFELDSIPKNLLEDADAIVVCVVMVNDTLISEIEDKTQKKVVKFEDLIYEI